jgi:hypothetical protein
MMGESFGFKVQHGWFFDPEGQPWRKISSGKFEVTLPHQCDDWVIADDPQDQAIIYLEDFISEAQRALEALRRGETFGSED